MGLLGRIFRGGINVLTAPIRAAIVPFTFAAKMLKTGVQTLGNLATLHPIRAFKTLIGGTVKNTLDAGITLASAGNPAIAFVDGFARSGIRLS